MVLFLLMLLAATFYYIVWISVKRIRGISISPCTRHLGWWGRNEHALASKSSGLEGLLGDQLHLLPVLCCSSRQVYGWGNALQSLMEMLDWIGLCWCLRWKLNAPKISIFVVCFLACYFENMKKPESFWCCDFHAIWKVAFHFIQNKKLMRCSRPCSAVVS